MIMKQPASSILIVVACAALLLVVVAVLAWSRGSCSLSVNTNANANVTPCRSLYARMRVRVQHPVPGQPVPKIIWQTWHSLPLPPGMERAVRALKAAHPDFTYMLMDETMCYDYIYARFPHDVALAFQTLRPGAYKADLWRLCVLYNDGGVYLDIKYKCVPPFSFHALLDKAQFVRDRVVLSSRGMKHGIYNALMVCPPGDARILACIEHIVQNVQTRYYGLCCLEPTGPVLVAKHIDTRGADVTMQYGQSFNKRDDTRYIKAFSPALRKKFGKTHLLRCYKGYTREQDSTQTLPHYSVLWRKRLIYDDDADADADPAAACACA